jgi:phosphoribosylamine--glycine ligase/phosphoribosylformylglycinamidine cyclo-ligase
MNVLVLGSGGREHALAWKIAQSTLLSNLYVLPGNPGTAQVAENLSGSVGDTDRILAAIREKKVDLVIVGPEMPLALGISDRLTAQGIPVFGPTAAAARLESSKAFAKAFMQRHQIPTARFEIFEKVDQALQCVKGRERELVIKASGLAAGKGVYLVESAQEAEDILHRVMVEGVLGEAGRQVVIEERLRGREVSLLVFTDGKHLLPMPPAQDHKRLLDDDRGPNTGGMGVFAPSEGLTVSKVREVCAHFLKPAIDGMRAEGNPFVGVLYAGLILTEEGPKILEFNCRFGDPETQVILPLLQSDLLEIFTACVEGRLHEVESKVAWSGDSAVCVVVASGGYPESYPTGLEIQGLEALPEEILAFHAGTSMQNGKVRTNGGRVLGITARATGLELARERAYQAVQKIHFDGMQYRKDIAHPESVYASAGVDISAGNRAVRLMKQAVESTHGPEVLAGVGSFGGLYLAEVLQGMENPVLAASTDSVGTKIMMAIQMGRYRGLGFDIVNHCVNDILVQGARPLFFLDYIGTSSLSPEVVAEMVEGVAQACLESKCALIGGETAELPGMYTKDQIDLVGSIVGVVERSNILPKENIQVGDLLLGLASSGPHTNGYSLLRKLFSLEDLNSVEVENGKMLGEALLAPHRSYLPLLDPILDRSPGGSPIKGLAHITGGGFMDNIPRVLPEGLGAKLMMNSWPVPPVFQWVQRRGEIPVDEMYRVFNMGIGMVVIVAPDRIGEVQSAISEPAYVIGEVKAGTDVLLS